MVSVIDENDCTASTIFIQQMCIQIRGLDKLDCITRNKQLLESLGQPYEMLIHLLHQQNDYLTFSCIATVIDRLMASIFLTVVHQRGTDDQLPVTLSEVLASEQVKTFLGDKIAFIISVLVASPVMLNIRNIIWHGFLDARELDSMYVDFIVLLYVSVCQVIQAKTDSFVLKPRIKYKVDEVEEERKVQLKRMTNRWEGIDHGTTFIQDCKSILSNSYFNIPFREPIVIAAIEQYEKAIQAKDEQISQYHLLFCSNLLFPQFEHALRRLFVSINPCVPESELIAESEVLYTTFDAILHNQITQFEQPNMLGEELGDTLTDALLDCFLHYTGPRLRDKAAHGSIMNMDSTLMLHYIMLYLALCDRYRFDTNETLHVWKMLQRFDDHSLYDIRTMFTMDWNSMLPQIDKYEKLFTSVGSSKYGVPEIRDYQCLFEIKDGIFTYAKSKQVKELQFDSIDALRSSLRGKVSLTLTIASLRDTLSMFPTESSSLDLKYKNHYYVTEQQLSNVNMCRRMITYMTDSLAVLYDKIIAQEQAIDNRTARTSHRKSYGIMIRCASVCVLLVKVYSSMLLGYYLKMDQDIRQDEFYKGVLVDLHDLLSYTERLYEAVKAGTIGTYLAMSIKWIV